MSVWNIHECLHLCGMCRRGVCLCLCVYVVWCVCGVYVGWVYGVGSLGGCGVYVYNVSYVVWVECVYSMHLCAAYKCV